MRGMTAGKPRAIRLIVMGLLTALIVPLLMTAFASPARADDDEADNYSLYQLASNASTYFGQENSPSGDGLSEDWEKVAGSPATGGSLLGYADPEFSLSNVIGWLFAEVSGSSQTIKYDTLQHDGKADDASDYAGMLDYAHFGAANADLGLDSTTSASNPIGPIMSAIGGSIIWVLYALALAVGMVFFLVISLLKLVNPFLWFGEAVSSINATFGEGMTRGQDAPAALKGLSTFISDWYGLLNSMAWEVLVPLFIGFLLIGLVLFKKMDRGSAVKKLVVRVVFIGVGLPLLGSMYTGVLNQFDEVGGQSAGPTRVVLSTYVDFESWMMNDRLAIPEEASIGWNGGQADSSSLMSVRTSALAINRQSYGGGAGTFGDIHVATRPDDSSAGWDDGLTGLEDPDTGGSNAIFATFGILNKYITADTVAASDFESGIKGEIASLSDVKDEDKESWFIGDDGYGDPNEYGDPSGPAPVDHPVISTRDQQGLTSSHPGGDSTTFTTTNAGTAANCKFTVLEDGAPASCNLSPLAAYNYLNTSFGPESLTMYSSNNASSGFLRDSHTAVSQVGTGPAKFMYWFNAATVLACIVVLGLWYALGMLAGSVKRTFSLVAAIPFATLGAMAAIAKVIVYSTALILEVLVTLFLYQFVSEFLISVPGVVAGPVSELMGRDGLLGSAVLGSIVVVILTMVSSLLVIGVTFALLRVRKVVLQAMDEVFTKLVDKFLETSTAPKPDKSGMLPSLAAGAGAGVGMAMGDKMANAVGSKFGGAGKSPTGKPGGGKTASTNAGGLNGDPKALSAGKGALALESGLGGNSEDPNGPNGHGEGPDGPGGGSSDSESVRALPASGAGGSDGGQGRKGADGEDAPQDKGGPLQIAGAGAGTSKSDKDTAQNLRSNGGLSKLGYSAGGQNGQPSQGQDGPTGQKHGRDGASEGQGGKTDFGLAAGAPNGAGQSGQAGKQAGANGSGPVAGDQASNGQLSTSRGRKAVADQSNSTQFGIGQQSHGVDSRPGTGARSGEQTQTQGARFTAGTSGPTAQPPQGQRPGAPAQGGAASPGVPATRSTRAKQGAPANTTPVGTGGRARAAQRAPGLAQQPMSQRPGQSSTQRQNPARSASGNATVASRPVQQPRQVPASRPPQQVGSGRTQSPAQRPSTGRAWRQGSSSESHSSPKEPQRPTRPRRRTADPAPRSWSDKKDEKTKE